MGRPGLTTAAHGLTAAGPGRSSLLAKAPVVIPIPGASRPESITDSARAADLTLSPADLTRLDQS